jgi:hypothetical protein
MNATPRMASDCRLFVDHVGVNLHESALIPGCKELGLLAGALTHSLTVLFHVGNRGARCMLLNVLAGYGSQPATDVRGPAFLDSGVMISTATSCPSILSRR